MDEIVCIKTYPSRIEAQIAKGLLEKNGIKAIVSADDAGGMHPDLLWGTGGARLLVQEKDKEKAASLLEK
jgi:hypothetical protein